MKKSFLITIMLLFITMIFCSCSNFTSTIPNDGVDDSLEDDTWETFNNADSGETYRNLITGVYNSLKDVSTDRINLNNPIFSVDSKLDVVLNQRQLFLVFKMNYNFSKLEDLKFAIELLDENEEVLIGTYFYNNFLYLKLMDGESGKIKFPLNNSEIGALFPLDFDAESTFILDNSNLINSLIKIDGNITGKTRMNGTSPEYEYNFYIDLPATLYGIVSLINDKEQSFGEFDIENISSILQRVLGISFEDVTNNDLPVSSIKVNFSTLSNKLSSFSMDINIDQTESSKNTLFNGDVIDLTINLESMSIDDQFTSIDFLNTNEYMEYTNYIEHNFGARINVIKKAQDPFSEDQHYLVDAKFKLDLENAQDTKILFEILDQEENSISGIYIYDGMLFLYSLEDNIYTLQDNFSIDINDVVEKLLNGIDDEPNSEEEKIDTIKLISYIVGALKILPEEITFTIDEDFYEFVLPNFENIIAYIDNALVDIDLNQLLNDAGFNPSILFENTFVLQFDTSEDAEEIIYIVENDIVFPDGVINYENE